VTEDIVTELDNKKDNCLEVTLVKYTVIGLQGSTVRESEEF